MSKTSLLYPIDSFKTLPHTAHLKIDTHLKPEPDINMNFILFSGYIGSGKSFAAEQVHKLIQNSQIIAFGAKVKDDTAALYNIPRHLCETQEGKLTLIPEYGKTVRDLLIQYSADMKYAHGDDVWAIIVAETIRNTSHITTWIINDWRYRNELEVLRKAFPDAQFKTIRIHRSTVQSKPFPSEHALDDYLFDHAITNDDTAEELSNQLINKLTI
jgi:hypothetical protein